MPSEKTVEEILESRIKQHHGSKYLAPCTSCAEAAMESFAAQEVEKQKRKDAEIARRFKYRTDIPQGAQAQLATAIEKGDG